MNRSRNFKLALACAAVVLASSAFVPAFAADSAQKAELTVSQSLPADNILQADSMAAEPLAADLQLRKRNLERAQVRPPAQPATIYSARLAPRMAGTMLILGIAF